MEPLTQIHWVGVIDLEGFGRARRRLYGLR
jgi:hypothetical protein